jgi:hypothetical protein
MREPLPVWRAHGIPTTATSSLNIASRLTSRCRRCDSANVARTRFAARSGSVAARSGLYALALQSLMCLCRPRFIPRAPFVSPTPGWPGLCRPPDPGMPRSCPRALRARSPAGGRMDSHHRTSSLNIASRLTSRCRRYRSENLARSCCAGSPHSVAARSRPDALPSRSLLRCPFPGSSPRPRSSLRPPR